MTIMYKMTLTAKNLRIEKKCHSIYECFIFERDLPAKYNLLFEKKPYVIGKVFLKNLDLIK